MIDGMKAPPHPGVYIRSKFPKGVTVTQVAKILGVGRPALSNLLNGKANLSEEMATRLEKSFGLDRLELLHHQAELDLWTAKQKEPQMAVQTYVPQFLRIGARQIEMWVDRNISARQQLPVLIRMLVHSTGRDLSLVDFPGNDDAERKGWDGTIEATAITPWIPNGKSGWEFGCNQDPKSKAEKDYVARVKATSNLERLETTFVFVTPRAWPGKAAWVKLKKAEGDWREVRAYDSSDLEQWLEQSIPAQVWFGERIGIVRDGIRSLDEQWNQWASVTKPELPRSLFESSIKAYGNKVHKWLTSEPFQPFIISADSKDEALAFVCSLFTTPEFTASGYEDRSIVFSTAAALKTLAASSQKFIAVAATEDVERELGSIKAIRSILIRPRNNVDAQPDIVLNLPGHELFREALMSVGMERHQAETLAYTCGYSPTVLRRRLATVPVLRIPAWASDATEAKWLIPITLAGTWHAQTNADREILRVLGDIPYDQVERHLARLLSFDDPPVWSVGQYRGVASKLDSLFAIAGLFTQKNLDDFFFVAELVLSERDPSLDLPEDQRPFASLYGKLREHSSALRQSICETLVILAVHGNTLFQTRLGVDVSSCVDRLIEGLLTPLVPERLLSQTGSLPVYAEAAPAVFLRILEEDLQLPNPQTYCLLAPAGTGVLATCPRSGLLWALERLAWKPENLIRVSLILARMANKEINDNWSNKPIESLVAIYRAWMPQTAASLEERMAGLQALVKRYPRQGWTVCRDQFEPGPKIGHFNNRPQWRTDASGAGDRAVETERQKFVRFALDLALAWPTPDEQTLGDLISDLAGFTPPEQEIVWNLVKFWASREPDEKKKAVLREQIRLYAFTRRSRRRSPLGAASHDEAQRAYNLLAPKDVVLRNQWLFAKNWIEPSAGEIDSADYNWEERDRRIQSSRLAALREIWCARGLGGLEELAKASEAVWIIGHCLGEIAKAGELPDVIRFCFRSSDPTFISKSDQLVAGIVARLTPGERSSTTNHLIPSLDHGETVRFLRNLPFGVETWARLQDLGPEVVNDYWKQVQPGWTLDGAIINEAVDRLIEVRRPRAAFHCAHMSLETLETSRLKKLLLEVGTSDGEASGTYMLNSHDISEAMNSLEKRAGITEEELAHLELMFAQALDHSEHGIPNLERQLAKSPLLFTQIIALTYKRSDSEEDPPEWGFGDPEKRRAAASVAYMLLERMRLRTVLDQAAMIDVQALRSWTSEVRALCSKHGRAAIGDQILGGLISRLPIGRDGVLPCEAAREVMEEIASKELARGFAIGIYNSRGAHFRGDGGDQEWSLAAKYRGWAKKLVEYPYVSRTLEEIAAGYEKEAVSEDLNAALSHRLHR